METPHPAVKETARAIALACVVLCVAPALAQQPRAPQTAPRRATTPPAKLPALRVTPSRMSRAQIAATVKLREGLIQQPVTLSIRALRRSKGASVLTLSADRVAFGPDTFQVLGGRQQQGGVSKVVYGSFTVGMRGPVVKQRRLVECTMRTHALRAKTMISARIAPKSSGGQETRARLQKRGSQVVAVFLPANAHAVTFRLESAQYSYRSKIFVDRCVITPIAG